MKIGAIRPLAALLLLLAALPALAQPGNTAAHQEGLHYQMIEGAPAVGSGPIEVIEAFSYLCSHCSTFDPHVEAWAKRLPENVLFRRLPVVFGRDSWEIYARAYLTADALGVAEAGHGPLMDRLWKEKKVMRSMEELAEFYAQFGADPQKFMATARSFAIESRLKREQMRVQSFGIRGTPSLVVQGKYMVAGNAAVPSFEAMLDVADFLIEKESAGLQQASVASD
jgi:thiol:disulfide interchange protein DsbA